MTGISDVKPIVAINGDGLLDNAVEGLDRAYKVNELLRDILPDDGAHSHTAIAMCETVSILIKLAHDNAEEAQTRLYPVRVGVEELIASAADADTRKPLDIHLERLGRVRWPAALAAVEAARKTELNFGSSAGRETEFAAVTDATERALGRLLELRAPDLAGLQRKVALVREVMGTAPDAAAWDSIQLDMEALAATA